MTLTDDRLAAALEDMAGHPDAGALVADVLRAIDSTPQQRRRSWLSWPSWPSGLGLPVPVLVALLLLAVTLAGTIAVGSGLVRLPWLVTVPPTTTFDGNGEIAIRGAGCEILGETSDGSSRQVITDGFPDCYPGLSGLDMAWSPDGQQLAMAYTFFCGRRCGSPEAQTAIAQRITGLWLLDAATDTFDQLVVCDLGCVISNPRWSPDGSTIAYRQVGPGDPHLGTVSATGGLARPIESLLVADVADVAWSPDSNRLALARRGAGQSFVSVIDADGSNETSVFETFENVESVDWSPDGRTLVIAIGDSVALIELIDDGPRLRATNGSPVVLYAQPDGLPIMHVRWSPDGSRIAWVEAGDNESDRTFIPDVRYGTMASDGADRTVAFDPWEPIVYAFSAPSWSPDGAYLTLGIQMQNGIRSYVTAADGSGQPILIDTNPNHNTVSAPAWRPVAAP